MRTRNREESSLNIDDLRLAANQLDTPVDFSTKLWAKSKDLASMEIYFWILHDLKEYYKCEGIMSDLIANLIPDISQERAFDAAKNFTQFNILHDRIVDRWGGQNGDYIDNVDSMLKDPDWVIANEQVYSYAINLGFNKGISIKLAHDYTEFFKNAANNRNPSMIEWIICVHYDIFKGLTGKDSCDIGMEQGQRILKALIYHDEHTIKSAIKTLEILTNYYYTILIEYQNA